MFTQVCIIRKNTDELINKLSNLGDRKIAFTKEKNRRRGLLVRPKFATGLPYDSWEFNLDKYLSENKFIIDCGTNEELFLAIAALRDDTDKNQWFVYDNSGWAEEPEIKYFVCRENSIKDEICIDLMYNDCHKCTVEELIEYFKNK